MVAEDLWEEGFAALQSFKAREGHCLVPQRHVEGAFRLGKWVRSQRKSRDTMPAECRQRLDAIGFSWDPLKLIWEDGLGSLKQYQAREGHCRVPQRHIEGTFKLGMWVHNQRGIKTKLSDKRRRRLDAIGFVWNLHDSIWEEGLTALERFKAREGHLRVPRRHIEDNFKLAQWVTVQRRFQEAMPAERRQRLNAVGFAFDPYEMSWQKALAALTAFKAREGHCRVPMLHVEGAIKLGAWVTNQRARKDEMRADRRQRMDEIGFVWDVRWQNRPMIAEDRWDEGFAALHTFKVREGHCSVPALHNEGKFKLGIWVNVQRINRGAMPTERIQRLDGIGFIWDRLQSDWEEGLVALQKFKAREGHCRVPSSHLEGWFELGQWVSRQRRQRERMRVERRQQLDEIGFEWNSRESAWEYGFAALKQFKIREGHCRVPDNHVEGTLKLGKWVRVQRQTRASMPAGRKERLDEIGFVWRVE
jgi:hypothetical protein